MFERFDDRTRKVVALANLEAIRHKHEYIGTEHVLIAMLKEGSGLGVEILREFVGDLDKLRAEIERQMKPCPFPIPHGRLPQSPEFKKMIEYAIEEDRLLKVPFIGTEHLVLGLLRQPETVTAQVLMANGASLELARSFVKQIKDQ